MTHIQNPLVSVIVPNYNYGRYLVQRIESILKQDFDDYELILLDDASTDNSASILDTYKNNPHTSHILINKENTGSPFQQWMKGIEMSRGKYVWIAEADDLIESHFLSTCIPLCEAHPDTAVCYVGSKVIFEDGSVKRQDINHWGKRSRKPYAVFQGHDYALHNLYWKNYIINASAVIFNREKALTLKHSSFMQMRYCGDWLFWFEMTLQGQVIKVYQSMNYFRQHAAKVTASSRRKGDGVLEDAQIVHIMETHLDSRLSSYQKQLRRGLVWKKALRLKLEKEDEHALLHRIEEILHCNENHYHLAQRNKWLKWFNPWLITPKRDRL